METGLGTIAVGMGARAGGATDVVRRGSEWVFGTIEGRALVDVEAGWEGPALGSAAAMPARTEASNAAKSNDINSGGSAFGSREMSSSGMDGIGSGLTVGGSGAEVVRWTGGGTERATGLGLTGLGAGVGVGLDAAWEGLGRLIGGGARAGADIGGGVGVGLGARGLGCGAGTDFEVNADGVDTAAGDGTAGEGRTTLTEGTEGLGRDSMVSFGLSAVPPCPSEPSVGEITGES